jgi:amidohydrolase
MKTPDFPALAGKLEEQLIAWRRDFHTYPELGFQEERTAATAAAELQSLGHQVVTGIGTTGVVSSLKGSGNGKSILLRFDMDALPVQETSTADYASQVPGVMHACGHDGHVAIGMGCARLLTSLRADLPGDVIFVFQPAEEGLGGAERMLADGLLERWKPDAALALHLWNDWPVGVFGIVEGPVMAGADAFEMTVRGHGGHGAAPQQTHDPIIAAAQIISALQTIVSRNVSPLDSAVVSVTAVTAGDTFNVIPSEAKLKGTIRTFDAQVRTMILERLEAIARGIADSYGCTLELVLRKISPPLVNQPGITRSVSECIEQLYPRATIQREERVMGSEDMAQILEQVPGCYFFVGSKDSERGLDAPHHNPAFDFDESALTRGVAAISAAAWKILEEV